MRKTPTKKNPIFLFLIFLFLTFIFSLFYFTRKEKVEDIKLSLLVVGDIFLDRGIDAKSQASKLKYAYPFSGLSTLEREKYDAWVGNLECPVTDRQSTKYEKEVYLKFSCKKEYLPELKKYFDIVSLANNHTDNMGRDGFLETQKHLDSVGIKYFGDPDNSQTENVCNIIYVKEIPLAFCGFHGVYKLLTEGELEIVKEYAKYFVTIVMPHQGEEYLPKSNSFQQKIYRKIIDNGADVVFGAHPHVIQEVEDYKNKKIFYSLGNFIFDQSWSKTREHMVVATDINFPAYNNNYKNLNCTGLDSLGCLKKAQDLNIIKPDFSLNFKQIYTHADLDFITKLKTK